MPSSARSLGPRSLTLDRRSFRRPPKASSRTSPSPANRQTSRERWIPSEPFETLPKSLSEPVLPGFSPSGGSEDESPRSSSNQWLYRPMTWTDVLSPHLHRSESLRSSREEYQKDAKVVITVTMEGTTGPFRTMTKLGSSVEETIQLVLDKYGEEGRTPSLEKNSASSYDLHLSSFTFESLDRNDTIGDVGSRSFYLRHGRRPSFHESSSATVPEIVETAPNRQPSAPAVFFPSIVSRKLVKFMRNIWKLFSCFHCD